MPYGFTQLAERRILAALAEGKLSHLAGEGRPLPDHPEDAYIEPDEALAFRLMREAGIVPKELELNNRRHAARAAWRAATPAERERLMPVIADLDMRYAIAHEARLQLMKHR